jgi:hypothetical protein
VLVWLDGEPHSHPPAVHFIIDRAMLQLSLLSGPERFARWAGSALDMFVLSVSYVHVAALQHCSVHACGVYICRWSTAVWNLQPCLHV